VRDDRERLLDILEAIEKIELHAHKGRETFERDELIQVWMTHHVQVIGEAASNVSEDLMSRHPEVPWRRIAAMRNMLVHVYFRVDLDEVWEAVERDIPVLKAQIEAILEAEEQD